MMRLIRARIDSAALRANLKLIRSRAPNSRVMAVVKANAYGHGLVPTALGLIDADAFAVARLEEAIALRTAGLKHRIVLLEGVFDAAQLAGGTVLGVTFREPQRVTTSGRIDPGLFGDDEPHDPCADGRNEMGFSLRSHSAFSCQRNAFTAGRSS